MSYAGLCGLLSGLVVTPTVPLRRGNTLVDYRLHAYVYMALSCYNNNSGQEIGIRRQQTEISIRISARKNAKC